MHLSLILPCFNEEQNIERTVRDVSVWMQGAGIDGEIIVVNDGSTDATSEKLGALTQRHPNLRVIVHETNEGYGAAVRSGCDAATKEYIAFMDADGQFHAADFDRLLAQLASFGFVTGRRIKRADPFLRKAYGKLFGLLVFAILGVWVRDINCAMKVFHREVWRKVRPTRSTGALFNAEMFHNLKREGIPWHQVDVSHYPRQFGEQTGANPGVILKMFRELLELKKK